MKRSFSSAMRSPVVPIPRVLPVGYRFNPSDEELIGYYLVMLLSGLYSNEMPIGIVNFLDFEPGQLPGKSRVQSDDQVWYFFSQRVVYMDRKKRMYKRKTRSGHWSPTGESTIVENLGKRSTLRFYKDSPKQKTEWIAYEYEIAPNSILPNPGEFVIIKLMKSSGEKKSMMKTSGHLNHSSVLAYCPTKDSPYIPKNQEDCIMASDFENQKLPSEVEDCPTNPTPPKGMSTSASDPNQTLDEVMTASGCCSYQVPAEFGNQDVGNASIVPSFSRVNQSSQMVSAGEMMNIASGNGHEVAPSDSECQNRVEMSAMSSRDTGEPSSWATLSRWNYSSLTEVQNRGFFSMRASPCVPKNQEEHEYSDCLFASDFENQKLPSEVEDNALKMPPCLDNQRALDGTDPSSSMTSRLEDNIQNEEFNQSSHKVDDLWSLIDFNVDEFPEVDIEVLRELDAFDDLHCLLNPEMQETINGDIRMKSD